MRYFSPSHSTISSIEKKKNNQSLGQYTHGSDNENFCLPLSIISLP